MLKIERRASQKNFDSISGYLNHAFKNEEESNYIIDLLTVHETFFFREKKHFGILFEKYQNKNDAEPVRIWSAACSTGEEAYSIALTLADAMGLQSSWSVLGTDVSPLAVKQAREGIYPMHRLHEVDERVMKNYCLKGSGPFEGMMQIKKQIREKTSFKTFNLNESFDTMDVFDAIFIRNVLIYFENETQENIIKKAKKITKIGGLIFLGKSETARGVKGLSLVGQSTWRRDE